MHRRLGDVAQGYGPSRLMTVRRAYEDVISVLDSDHTAVDWLRETVFDRVAGGVG